MPVEITVSTVVNAPLQHTWNAWTQPEHITQWNFASDDWHCPSAENDLRVGGAFSSRMAAKDGSAAFDFGGTHTDVRPLERIASEMGDGRKFSVNFEAVSNDHTRVTETFEAESTHSEDMQRAGWQAILESFKRHAESSAAQRGFITSTTPKITPFLWLESRAEEAARFYASVFPNAEVLHSDAQIATVRLEGQEFHLLNGGAHFKLSPAFSIFVQCHTQAEIDDLWTKLTADGGKESQCGWLEDKFGVSWQLCPPLLVRRLHDPDPEKATRVRDAMMQMHKLDIAALQRAYDGA